MTKTLKRVAPVQFGKVTGAIYGFFALLFVPFFLLVGLFGGLVSQGPSAPPPLLVFGLALVGAIGMPILYAGMGFLVGALSAWGYNLIAHWVGGIQVEVE